MAVSGRHVHISEAIDTCFATVDQTPVVLTTSNDGWNQLATGFVNGISGGLTNDQITSIGNIIFGKGGDAGKVTEDLIGSQPWLIVFVSIGAAFSVLTLIGALATCIWACTCRRSSKGIKSQCLNITGIILAFISFGFVVAGIVLYALSTSGFVNGVLAAPAPLGIILDNSKVFATEATNEVNCAVTQGFGSINDDIRLLPSKMISAFEDGTSISKILAPDYDKLSADLEGSKGDVQTILTALNALPPMNDVDAQKQVDDAKTAYGVLHGGLDKNSLPKYITDIGTSVKTVKTSVEDSVNKNAGDIVTTATGAIDGMVKTVQETLDGATNVINTVLQQVQQMLDYINNLEKDLNKNNDVSGWITAGFDVVIIVPCVIALIAALVAFVVGLFFALQKTSLPSKGCCSASCTLITLSIIVLTIAFVVMVPASLAMTVGYGANLVCQPFFYDESLSALKAVDSIIPDLKVPMMNGSEIQLYFSDIMVSCEKSASFMNAVHGGDIIDITVIESAFNPETLAESLNGTIAKTPITPLNKDDLAKLNTALDQVNIQPPLNLAFDKDPNPAEIKAIQDQMAALALNLQPTIDECKDIAGSAQDFTDPTAIITMLQGTSTDFIFEVYANLTSTAETFMDDLLSKTASCKPIYQSYEDLGHVACEQMAGGVQGMWAAAGLAALFFLPTVIAVFCVASALRGGKAKHRKSVNPSPDLFY